MKYQAVIFDLFGTLVNNFSIREQNAILLQMASIVSAPADEFMRLWLGTFNERATGILPSPETNIEYICRKLGIRTENAHIRKAAKIRFDLTVRSMVPRAGAIELLSSLKTCGYKTGLISDCSAELPAIWQDTPFAPLIDVPIFSCTAGMKKPDPRIYRIATDQLGVEPETCLYIGDGSSGELTGAAQVGMHPVLLSLLEDNPDAHQIDREEWAGPTISSLSEVLMLVGLTKQ
jgi:putative hydrolase of the HAD superfamily